MNKPFNPAIADNLRELFPEKRGITIHKHPSYDLFSYLFELLRSKLKRRKAIVGFASQYHDTREKLTDFKSIDKHVFKANSIRSPGMAWQISELIYGGFFAETLLETDSLEREIKDLSFKIRKAKESKDLEKEKDLKREKRDLTKQKDEIRSFMDTKPVWGKSYGGDCPTSAYYIKDDDAGRVEDARNLPPLCFRMKLHVPMKTNIPLLIKGDRPFVANENPFCIDKVTGWPLLRPSTLKGQTRHATFASLIEENSTNPEQRVDAIFGPEDMDKEKGHRGRVEFLPCYLKNSVDFDIIAPHDEKTRRVDPGPVTFEVIRPKTLPLWLQYWPLDFMSKWYTGKRDGIGQEIFDDFVTILKGLSCWFDAVGIGAKTSSGYGQVEYHGATAQLFAAPEGPWAKLAKKILSDESTARPINEISQVLNRDEWENIWNAFEQDLKKEGDENAG